MDIKNEHFSRLYGIHNFVLLQGKSVQAFGSNEFGQLGDGTFFSRNETKPIDISQWKALSSYSHILAISTDDELFGWV